jgi:hypothetical protein
MEKGPVFKTTRQDTQRSANEPSLNQKTQLTGCQLRSQDGETLALRNIRAHPLS